MKILILASNPRKDLNLDREIRDLKEVIKKSHNRLEFEVEDALAVRVGDLQELLFSHRPQIVHFCGHGSGQQGLVFEGSDGGEQWVRAEALSDLFRLFAENVGCVLLNACYSEEQANAIVNHIDYVIGMNQEIRDDAAIAFSKGFYRALGYECSIEQAYEFGRNAIQLEISGSSKKTRSTVTEAVRKIETVDAIQRVVIPEHLKPILKTRLALMQNLEPVVSGSEQVLSQAKREEIQLDVAKVLTEEKPGFNQFREQVKEYLQDRHLAEYEKDLLDALREELGLSTEEADEILEEEQAPIRQAQQAYEKRLVALLKYYPLSDVIQEELRKFQVQRKLTDEEVNQISQPILEQAEADYQAKLTMNRQASIPERKPSALKVSEFQVPTISERKLIPIDPELYSQYQEVDRWAVIVGISEYQHQSWNLKYADRDAEDLYELLLTPNGGKYKQENIRKLTNKQATSRNILIELHDFLKKPAREDLVLLYFACHGSPDPDRPNNLYLITHDTEPSRIAGTALPMREIRLAIKETLLAKKVILLVDSCHSGGISEGVGFRSASHDSAQMKRYLEELSRSSEGLALLTSAETSQVAREGEEWGGGHGVFTHYLLEGIRGAADDDNDGIVTVGELFEYVRDNVKRATSNQQHPVIGSLTNRKMPVAVVPNATLPTKSGMNQQPQDSLESRGSALEQADIENLDVTFEIALTAEEMSAGTERHIITEQGGIVVKIPPGVSPGKRVRVRGKGQTDNHSQQNGDLYLKISEILQTSPHCSEEPQELNSACGANYMMLRELLSKKKWQEADKETNKIIEKIICQSQIGVKGIPCQDLWTIDQLWMNYSNNHFGLSKQHQVWQCLVENVDRRWKSLFVQLGWMTEIKREFANLSLGNKYVEVNDISLYRRDTTNAQLVGYLPSVAKSVASKHSLDAEKARQIMYFFSRLSECNFNG